MRCVDPRFEPRRHTRPIQHALRAGLSLRPDRFKGRHLYVLFDAVPYRLDKTLSDIKGRDPYVHGHGARATVRAVLEVLQSPGEPTDPVDVYRLHSQLVRVKVELKRRHDSSTIFTRAMFERVVALAVRLAVGAGLLGQRE